MRKSRLLISVLFLGVAFLHFQFPQAYAKTIPQDVAVRIIVGEAADQGLKGMICVGEVLRRRGSTKGFYGYPSNLDRRQPDSIWQTAAKAWRLSAHTDYTKGADHFENIYQFGKPWWAKYCIETYAYKDHVFYKEITPVRPVFAKIL